ncbi:FKBP-type peptidyl-prolyl cis-trans isomerase [Ferruginibacter lapsinanis]|uniref:FKBP-type peptidyl-prolyl cis-trans isomerase n=1 Tax=Ferruginibacter lapsinanis TaxID=563172 RepID=UPI001E2F3AD0|nr:FKBP-type peptidyl-prolyl cis-trans isomerase [Ferruginibacter lapsinanis]UEG49856.1 FKBP-type peptidyl-prolyl cis-trans isomerase [Ferruginibacter lapsinanis]
MNKYFLGFCVLVLSALEITSCSPSSKVTAVKPLATVDSAKVIAVDSFAYGLGMNIANNLKDQGVDTLDFDALKKAMMDIFGSKPTAITEHDANDVIQQKMQDYSTRKIKAEKAKGTAFFEANAKREGVISLPSGLQYEILKKGDSTSVMPKAPDTIIAHYVGTLLDGKEFDNSIKRGSPLTIKANEVIRGWTEIVQLMHIGDKWKVFIPAELAYGDRGAGADIPPGASIIFEMELLGVKPFVTPAPPAPQVVEKVVAAPPVKSKTKAKVKASN